ADEKDKVYEYEGSDAEDDESAGPPPPPPPQGAPKNDPFAPPFANAAAAAAVVQNRAAYIHQQQQQMAAQQRGGRPVQPPRQPPTFLPAQQQGARVPPQQLVQRVGMYRPPPAVQQTQQQQHRPASQVFNGVGLDPAGPRGSVIEVAGEPSTAVAAEEHTLRQKFARFQFSLLHFISGTKASLRILRNLYLRSSFIDLTLSSSFIITSGLQNRKKVLLKSKTIASSIVRIGEEGSRSRVFQYLG
ncbi:unnamed protein product, partial [Hymenolepis diminuta]|uniref:LsmAD domain-containing protein n=1 Tax=Hymenolepis diminuta TaxID=6216 RepID=A0A0R3SM10_HYMDI